MNKTPKQIIRIVSKYYKVDIRKKSRKGNLPKAKRMISYIIVPMFKMKQCEATKLLKYDALNSISYNLKTFRNDLRFDKETQEDYNNVLKLINKEL